MMLLGDKLPAPEAAEWGLIWKCVEDDKLMETAEAVARRFAAGPTVAYTMIKRLLHKAGSNSYREQVQLEAEYQTIVRATADHAEARKAFAEKRPPAFHGR
jgi:2-(1,2-epoxy-1,2-dihydrophenyl)acetyl-CoA isomerase